MLVVVHTFIKHKKEDGCEAKSNNVVNVLNASLDLDESLYMDACDLLKDEEKVKIFKALDVSKRKEYLMRKLDSNALFLLKTSLVNYSLNLSMQIR